MNLREKFETSGWGEKSVEDKSSIKEHGTYSIQKGHIPTLEA